MALTLQGLQSFLLWSTIINMVLLMCWFGMFWFAHDWIYRHHSRWFRLSTEQFDAIHYAVMAAYKVGILFLNVVPLIALTIMLACGVD